MIAKNLLTRGAIASALALTATLSGPAFAEYRPSYEYQYMGPGNSAKSAQRVVPNKVARATPKQRIKRSEIYLNTP